MQGRLLYLHLSTFRQAERLLHMAEKGYEYEVKIRLEFDDAQLSLLQAQINIARAEGTIFHHWST